MSGVKPIDIHTHYLPTALLEALERRTETPCIMTRDSRKFVQYGPETAYPLLPHANDLKLKLSEMDEVGISLAVLSVNIPGIDWIDRKEAATVARDANDELIEAANQNPDGSPRLPASRCSLPTPLGRSANTGSGGGSGERCSIPMRPVGTWTILPSGRSSMPSIHPTYPCVLRT